MPEYTDASTLVAFLPAGPNQTPLITGSSFPTLDTVASMIGQFSSELDAAALVGGYAVPISPVNQGAFRQMQMYCQEGAGAWALSQVFPNIGGPTDKTSTAGVMRAAYLRALSGLRDGSILLVDAPRDGGGQRPLPRSDNVPGVIVPPTITKDWRP